MEQGQGSTPALRTPPSQLPQPSLCLHMGLSVIWLPAVYFTSSPWGVWGVGSMEGVQMESSWIEQCYCRGSGQAAPKGATMAYWLFCIEATWEIAGIRRTLWPSSVPLKAGNKSLTKGTLPVIESRERPLSPETGTLGPRKLYKQILLLFTNLLSQPKFCSEFLPNWSSRAVVFFVLSVPHKFMVSV